MIKLILRTARLLCLWVITTHWTSGDSITIYPGVTNNREVPDTWSIDLRGKTQAEAQAVADGLSLRLYGAQTPELNQPIQFITDYNGDHYFALRIALVSLSGSSLQVTLDGQSSAVLSWPKASETHQVHRTYYFPISAGEHSIELKVIDASVTLMESYAIVDSIDELEPPAEELILAMNTPVIHDEKGDGYRGIWFTLGQQSTYGDKYSGGLGTYTANHNPLAIYSPDANKTFFVYGGTPSESQKYLQCMIGCFDHETNQAQLPTIVYDKGAQGVDDPHDNPSISIDDDGHIWVFVAGRNTSRDGIVLRSTLPYDINAFEEVRIHDGMTYPQPWFSDDGFLLLFTKYTSGRELYFTSSPNGRNWEADRKIVGFDGHYQVSSYDRGRHKLGTFFNYHPGGAVDKRTNLYYMQSVDGGSTWTTIDGIPLTIPLSAIDNPALVIDYAAQNLLQYTCDINWDADGNPLMLYITASHHQPGPNGDPRNVCLTRWDGEQWLTSVITQSTHNYDMGSVYVSGSRWTVLFPSQAGPQPWGTGGEIEAWTSDDQGEIWVHQRAVTQNSQKNHGYVRRPLNAVDPFYGFWADGNPDSLSISQLYFTNRDGTRVWQLPYTMSTDWASPTEINPPLEKWKSRKFTISELNDPLISGNDADPDQDGHENFIEYALLSDPQSSDNTSVEITLFENENRQYVGLVYDVLVDAADAQVTPMISASPNGPWNSGDAFLTIIDRKRINTPKGEIERIEVRDNLELPNAGPRFLKLEVKPLSPE